VCVCVCVSVCVCARACLFACNYLFLIALAYLRFYSIIQMLLNNGKLFVSGRLLYSVVSADFYNLVGHAGHE